MYFLHAINSDRQTRLLNVLGQIAMILGGKKITHYAMETSGDGLQLQSFYISVLLRPERSCSVKFQVFWDNK